jgi:CHAT domain-containing protein
MYLADLGNALQARFGRTGSIDDLNQAITAGQQAVDITPPDHPNLPGLLSNFGIALRARFERTGSLDDLNQAITTGQQAVDTTPPDHPDRPMLLSNLGTALQARFVRIGSLDDLNQAIAVGQRAVYTTPPDHPNLPMLLSNLGTALQARFGRTGLLDDLNQAISVGQQAVEATPPGHPNLPGRLSNLGGALQTRFGRTGSLDDLNQAITVGQQAVDTTPPDHPNLPRRLSVLAATLLSRYERTRDARDQSEAEDHLGRAARMAPRPSSVVEETMDAWHDGRDLACRGKASEALGPMERAIGLLRQAALSRVDVKHAREMVEPFQGLARDAAAVALANNQVELAVEWLEHGRVLLWELGLERRSGYMGRLQSDHPEVYQRLQDARRGLDTITTSSSPSAEEGSETGRARTPAPPSDSPSSQVDPRLQQVERQEQVREEASRALDELLQEVWALPGHSAFFKKLLYKDLAPAAAEGPIVIVNASSLGSHAIVLSGPEVPPTAINLGDDVWREAREHATYIARTDETESERPKAYAEVLRWLWDRIVSRVAVELGLDQASPPECLPRVWWVPTGPLARLPLHAAGYHPSSPPQLDETPDSRQFDRMAISSYTPTLRMLLDARKPSTPNPTMALVALPDPPSWMKDKDPLTHTDKEIACLSTWPKPGLDSPGQGIEKLKGKDAIREAVIAALKRAGWVHLSCHAGPGPGNPNTGGLPTYDELIPLEELASESITNPQLAFLSACSTSLATENLEDEAHHLAGAMLSMGYRHVVAALWPVFDETAADVTARFYQTLTAGSQPDPTNAARALHQAICGLRDDDHRVGADPYVWAALTHTGA